MNNSIIFNRSIKLIFLICIAFLFNACVLTKNNSTHLHTDFPISNKNVEQYVFNNRDAVFFEFQNFYDVIIDKDITFEVDDISQYTNDTNELGKCYPDLNLIIISNNVSRYAGYSIKNWHSKQLSSNIFVKRIMLHEICHIYIENTVGDERNTEKKIRKEYRQKGTFGSIFIEEGICEYSVINMGEMAIEKYVPKTINELTDTLNKYNVKYKYSFIFVKPILDYYGFKKGVRLLLVAVPPTYEEMLNPEKYYNKLGM